MKKNFLPWIVLAFLFVATGLSFLDRQVLSMTIIKIQAEFKFSDVEYGFVNTAFLISYALMFTVGGRLIDTWGSKIGLAVAVGIWSVACGLHGAMTGFYQLVAFRFLLGMGEGACFPGAAKTVYEWFDEKKRGLANGIAIGGAAMGAVIAPPLIILISSHFGWRWSFIIPAVAGIVWVIIWLYIPWGENSHAKKNQSIVKQSVIPFLTILKNRAAFTFILIRFLLDPVDVALCTTSVITASRRTWPRAWREAVPLPPEMWVPLTRRCPPMAPRLTPWLPVMLVYKTDSSSWCQPLLGRLSTRQWLILPEVVRLPPDWKLARPNVWVVAPFTCMSPAERTSMPLLPNK